ncbi:MAG TPA: DUF177 domain-containing protein [Dehalococcoidia bacterium]|nr:DUF177 domain-containing protein [Dehalococcoidia bacterium]
MDIHVAQLLKESVGATRDHELDEVADDPAEAGYEWARGPIRLTRTPQGILAQGELTAGYRDTCSRCLTDFAGPLTLSIEDEFYPTIDVVTGRSVEAPDDIDGFPIDAGHQIDLRDAVRQAAWLERSLAPLCRPDCAGLCPQCGRDLNTGRCDCRPEAIDARWANLARWDDGSAGHADVKEG